MYLTSLYVQLGAHVREEPVPTPWCPNFTLGRFSPRQRFSCGSVVDARIGYGSVGMHGSAAARSVQSRDTRVGRDDRTDRSRAVIEGGGHATKVTLCATP